MTEVLTPVVRYCVVRGCDQQAVGMACDNPVHKEIAAEVMDSNAGIPSMTTLTLSNSEDDCEVYAWLMGRTSVAYERLVEPPLVYKNG